MSDKDEALEGLFPGLRGAAYRVCSPFDPRYNCIAFAAGDQGQWWEPTPLGKEYWPPGIPREPTLEAYVAAFQSIGFEQCESGHLEPGLEKVALFRNQLGLFHAARQQPSGTWLSKLGKDRDIEHPLEALEGTEYWHSYGKVVQFLKRPLSQSR